MLTARVSQVAAAHGTAHRIIAKLPSAIRQSAAGVDKDADYWHEWSLLSFTNPKRAYKRTPFAHKCLLQRQRTRRQDTIVLKALRCEG